MVVIGQAPASLGGRSSSNPLSRSSASSSSSSSSTYNPLTGKGVVVNPITNQGTSYGGGTKGTVVSGGGGGFIPASNTPSSQTSVVLADTNLGVVSIPQSSSQITSGLQITNAALTPNLTPSTMNPMLTSGINYAGTLPYSPSAGFSVPKETPPSKLSTGIISDIMTWASTGAANKLVGPDVPYSSFDFSKSYSAPNFFRSGGLIAGTGTGGKGSLMMPTELTTIKTAEGGITNIPTFNYNIYTGYQSARAGVISAVETLPYFTPIAPEYAFIRGVESLATAGGREQLALNVKQMESQGTNPLLANVISYGSPSLNIVGGYFGMRRQVGEYNFAQFQKAPPSVVDLKAFEGEGGGLLTGYSIKVYEPSGGSRLLTDIFRAKDYSGTYTSRLTQPYYKVGNNKIVFQEGILETMKVSPSGKVEAGVYSVSGRGYSAGDVSFIKGSNSGTVRYPLEEDVSAAYGKVNINEMTTSNLKVNDIWKVENWKGDVSRITTLKGTQTSNIGTMDLAGVKVYNPPKVSSDTFFSLTKPIGKENVFEIASGNVKSLRYYPGTGKYSMIATDINSVGRLEVIPFSGESGGSSIIQTGGGSNVLTTLSKGQTAQLSGFGEKAIYSGTNIKVTPPASFKGFIPPSTTLDNQLIEQNYPTYVGGTKLGTPSFSITGGAVEDFEYAVSPPSFPGIKKTTTVNTFEKYSTPVIDIQKTQSFTTFNKPKIIGAEQSSFATRQFQPVISIQTQPQINVQRNDYKYNFHQINPPFQTTPNIPVPPTPFPIMPQFPKFDLSGGIGSRGFGASQRTKYTPDYGSLIFNIKGKQPKGMLTGIENRPIPKGFTWAFSIGKFFGFGKSKRRNKK